MDMFNVSISTMDLLDYANNVLHVMPMSMAQIYNWNAFCLKYSIVTVVFI